MVMSAAQSKEETGNASLASGVSTRSIVSGYIVSHIPVRFKVLSEVNNITAHGGD